MWYVNAVVFIVFTVNHCFLGAGECGVLPGSDAHWHRGLQEQEQSRQLLLVSLSLCFPTPFFGGF